jgi:hypothetical protein
VCCYLGCDCLSRWLKPATSRDQLNKYSSIAVRNGIKPGLASDTLVPACVLFPAFTAFCCSSFSSPHHAGDVGACTGIDLRDYIDPTINKFPCDYGASATSTCVVVQTNLDSVQTSLDSPSFKGVCFCQFNESLGEISVSPPPPTDCLEVVAAEDAGACMHISLLHQFVACIAQQICSNLLITCILSNCKHRAFFLQGAMSTLVCACGSGSRN